MTVKNPRWSRRPEGSTWGDWGADDQLGRLNLITPEAVRRGVTEVQAGLSFCLSLPLDLPGGNVLNPRRYPPKLAPTLADGAPMYNKPVAGMAHYSGRSDLTDVISDDAVLLYTQYSSQWDSLAHVGSLFDCDGSGTPQRVYYNGYRAGVEVENPQDAEGATALGIDKQAVKATQSRGLLVDLKTLYGAARHYVGYDDLMAALEAQRVEVESGDILCLYTGYADWVLEKAGKPDRNTLLNGYAVLDGRDRALQDWITRSGIAALVADNYAVEGLPARAGAGQHAALPLHEHCLFRLGLPLGELWHFGELAAWLRGAERNGFLLTAPPLRLPGAVGSPVTPVATV
ncbi:MAG: cyclase family protein [Rhodospirillales bacterium]